MEWKLEEQLCFLLYASSRNVIKAYKDILQPYALTYTQYITLVALWEQDHQLVSDLGSRLQLDSGTLTPLLKKLEKDGRITRSRDTIDQRKVYIDLTEAGQSLGLACKSVPNEIVKALKLNEQDVRHLYENLKLVYLNHLKGDKA